jgi:hypothetical protein
VPPPASQSAGAGGFLWPQNRKAWGTCLDMLTQVEVGGMGGVIGFKLGRELDRAEEMNGVGKDERIDVFRKVKAFERWWVAEINERVKAAAKK